MPQQMPNKHELLMTQLMILKVSYEGHLREKA